MRPSHKVRKLINKMVHKKLPPGVRHAKIKLDEACPHGTVPIARVKVTNKDLSKDISNLHKRQLDEWNHGEELRSKRFMGLYNVNWILFSSLACLSFSDTIRVLLPWNGNYSHSLQGYIQRESKTKKRYQGAYARINVYNPKVEPHQYSSAAISIEAGDGYNSSQIQIGWTVSIRKEKGFENSSVSITFYLRISYFLGKNLPLPFLKKQSSILPNFLN